MHQQQVDRGLFLAEREKEIGLLFEVEQLFDTERAARGTGVAWKLVEAGADQARKDGRSQLGYWVGTDNGRAVAFASSFGFRPTDTRRPMRVTNEADGAEEMAMVLPLGVDPGTVPSTILR